MIPPPVFNPSKPWVIEELDGWAQIKITHQGVAFEVLSGEILAAMLCVRDPQDDATVCSVLWNRYAGERGVPADVA